MPNPVYPALALDQKGSKRIPRDGREKPDIVGDGNGRVRKLHEDKSDFELRHPSLDATDQATLLAFYAANTEAPLIDFYWPLTGLTYEVTWTDGGAPREEWASPTRQHMYVKFVAAG